mgnify:CR=1 FL=1|tara:strand:- start:6760 stop:7794 length:1035 start_codon:yes stop_codon:yes gene_type:complete
MKLSKFNFELPGELIALTPLKDRSSSKLLVVEEGLKDLNFRDLPSLINSKDILVINDTKVFKARLLGKRNTGARAEILIERVIDDDFAYVQIKCNSPLKPKDQILFLNSNHSLNLIKKDKDLWLVHFSDKAKKVIEAHGSVPLPPYIKRDSNKVDEERYQTIYADPEKDLSVAAPTAGFHFNYKLLAALKKKDIAVAKITLHVGMGTFKPINKDNIKDHEMHKERIELKEEAINLINKAKSQGGRIICIGTTTLRCLESIAKMNNGVLKPFKGETDIFIYPGFKFNVVDSLVTNFHLPKSTLIVLVSAFGGYKKVMEAYEYAIKNEYRFYSYGDSMFINANLDK